MLIFLPVHLCGIIMADGSLMVNICDVLLNPRREATEACICNVSLFSKVRRVRIAGQAPSAILTFSSGVAVLYRRVNKAKASPPLPLSPEVQQSLFGFSDPHGFEGRAAGGVELPWDYPSLGIWLGLRQNPGELLG